MAWSILGKIGERWFPKRMTSKYAEACWKKDAETIHKQWKLNYPGPAAEKIVVDAEVPG